MALHKVDISLPGEANKYRCAVCGENALWIDDKCEVPFNEGDKKKLHPVGTNKGIVYATCNFCKKILCGEPHRRPAQVGSIRVSKWQLPERYRGREGGCLQEAPYINHNNDLITVQVCRDAKCMKEVEDCAKQKKLKERLSGVPVNG